MSDEVEREKLIEELRPACARLDRICAEFAGGMISSSAGAHAILPIALWLGTIKETSMLLVANEQPEMLAKIGEFHASAAEIFQAAATFKESGGTTH